MNIQQVTALTKKQIDKMTRGELSKATGILVSTVNKRLKRRGSSKRYSVKGKTRTELKRLRNKLIKELSPSGAVAKRSNKKVKTTSLANILKMSDVDVNSLKEKELRKLVQRMVTSTMSRVKNLSKHGLNPPALLALTESGGQPSTKGKNYNQLRKEFFRLKNFLEAETSTVKGAMKNKNTLQKELGVKQDLSDEIISKVWKLFHEVQKSNQSFIAENYRKALELVYDLVEDADLSNEELKISISNKLTKMYEEKAQKEAEAAMLSQDFHMLE